MVCLPLPHAYTVTVVGLADFIIGIIPLNMLNMLIGSDQHHKTLKTLKVEASFLGNPSEINGTYF